MKTIQSTIQPSSFSYVFPQDKKDILFFDIETTGLSAKTSSIYLIGIMFFDVEKDCFLQIQWFAERHKDEKELLSSFLHFLNHYHYLYHFNGKTFDIPYVLQKCKRHALPINEHAEKLLMDGTGVFSIDLLLRIRKLKHFLSLEKCNQKALEHYLGIEREDPFSGGDLITVYSEYTQMRLLEPEKAEALEKVLLLHNHEDVEMMLSVCSLLQYEILFLENTPLFSEEHLKHLTIRIQEHNQENAFLSLSLPLSFPMPKELLKTASYPGTEEQAAILELKKDRLLLKVPVCQDTLKYFFADYKNYYYLPFEDMAVHKSVSSFMDSSRRQKASPATCYARKESTFLPSLIPQKKKRAEKNTILFFREYGDTTAYYELPEDYQTNLAFWQTFLQEQIKCFL